MTGWFARFLYRRSLRSVLSIVMIALTVALLAAMALISFAFASQNILRNTQDHLSASLLQSNTQLEEKLNALEDAARSILLDQELYSIIAEGGDKTDSELFERNKRVKTILNKYFGQNSMLYGFRLITPEYVYGAASLYQPLDVIGDTSLYRQAVLAKGRMSYVPSFQFNEMFLQPAEWQFPYPHLFAAVKQLNLQYLASDGSGVPIGLPEHVTLPVLALYFDVAQLQLAYENTVQAAGGSLLMLDEAGGVCYPLGIQLPFPESALKNAHLQGEASFVKVESGHLIIARSLPLMRWTAVIYLPLSDLIRYTVPLLTFSALALIGMSLLSWLLAHRLARSIAAPMENLSQAIKKSGEGQFGVVLGGEGVKEMQALAESYNAMNGQIRELMKENAESHLRERDNLLRSMQLQMEPHFLYNTLNTINWMAINEGSLDISNMITKLARMLRYTLEHTGELASYTEDMNWTYDYVKLLQTRMGDRVSFEWDMDERLRLMQVPILLLQPFIENAVVHGLDQMESGGIVRIRGEYRDGMLYFTVADNGRGISEQQLQRIWAKDQRRIGIRNVDARIKLIYGDAYGITIESSPERGTKVNITFPDRPRERYHRMLNARIG